MMLLPLCFVPAFMLALLLFYAFYAVPAYTYTNLVPLPATPSMVSLIFICEVLVLITASFIILKAELNPASFMR